MTQPGPGLQSQLLLCPRPPSCQGENGHEGPQLSVLTMQTGEQSIFVNICLITYRRIAVQPSLAGPLLTESAAWMVQGEGNLRTLSTVLVQSCHVAAAEHRPQGERWTLRKMLNSSHGPTAALLQRCSNVGEKDRAELHQKGKVMRETFTPGLGLWCLMWASGAGHD